MSQNLPIWQGGSRMERGCKQLDIPDWGGNWIYTAPGWAENKIKKLTERKPSSLQSPAVLLHYCLFKTLQNTLIKKSECKSQIQH